MASPPGSPSSRWWNRPIKPEPAIGPNELEVETMVAGDGYRYAKPGMTVSVHYVGYLPDGRVFDATHRRGAPLRFRLDRSEVIEGLDAAAAQLSAGERAKVRMGCDRAYGDRSQPMRTFARSPAESCAAAASRPSMTSFRSKRNRSGAPRRCVASNTLPSGR